MYPVSSISVFRVLQCHYLRCHSTKFKRKQVGVLFGFGFDTASSIALLAVTALAKKNSSGQGTISQSDIIVLPLLFTAGMTLVDSIDSCVMLYSYAGFPEKGWSLLDKKQRGGALHVDGVEEPGRQSIAGSLEIPEDGESALVDVSSLTPASMSHRTSNDGSPADILVIVHSSHIESDISAPSRPPSSLPRSPSLASKAPSRKTAVPPVSSEDAEQHVEVLDDGDENLRDRMEAKKHTMSSLSIVLTLISILVRQISH